MPYDVILAPKKHFLSILSIFLQIFAYLTTMKSKFSNKTMKEIVHSVQEITVKQNFSQNLSPAWPYDVILTPENAFSSNLK